MPTRLSPEEKAERARKREKEKFMRAAIKEAVKARDAGDVPIGCVIVKDGRIIARGYNRRMARGNTLAHAEITAIDKACRKTGDWRLEECELFVTLEPCPMCAGAIVQARIPRVYIGSMNPKAGCAGSVIDLMHLDGLNHEVDTVTGLLGDECSMLMKDFFRDLRKSHPKKVKYRQLSAAGPAEGGMELRPELPSNENKT